MTKIIEYFTNNFPKEVVLILAVAILVYLITKNLNVITENLKQFKNFILGKKVHKEITIKDLENHFIFNHINHLKNVKINLLQFGDPARTYIIRLLIFHKLNMIENNLKKFLDTKDLDKYDIDELENLILTYMYNDHSTYINEFKAEACDEKETGVINIVIDAIWKTYNDNLYQIELNGVKEILHSPIYNNNYIRIHSLLLPYMVSIESFLITAEKTLNNLNGKLTGKRFHGYTFN